MGKRNQTFETHNFYCINCGEKNVPLLRSQNQLKSKGHRKNMYCYHCKHTINHVECRNEEESQDFIVGFKNGEYKEEAEDGLQFERSHPRYQDICNGRSAR